MESIAINEGWSFRQSTELNNGTAAEKWRQVSQFPTIAHIELLHYGLIPDPYIGMNEPETLWVGEADWEFKTKFAVGSIKNGQKAELVFEGLDTAVEVYLNGKCILSAKDMFLRYRVDVTQELAGLKEAELHLKFTSGVKKAREERERIGYNGGGERLNFGGTERLFLRKAQYHWGWDWGPVVNACGPYRDIFLEIYDSRVSDLQVVPELNEDLSQANIDVDISVEGSASGDLQIEIKDPAGELVYSSTRPGVKEGKHKLQIPLDNPQLWYPFMYGDQPLYTVSATFNDSHTVSKEFGIRKLRLVQTQFRDPEEKGLSFVFEVNNIEIFCGGSNWIPGDTMVPRMTKQKYYDWIKWAKRGNHTMVRIWGGGYNEEQAFFDACNREGILVWVDFQFSCGNYPAHGDYLENVKKELHQQVLETNHHPCLALYCGNNEDYLLADRNGWDWDRSDNDGPWDNTNFPARLIYEKVMPSICYKLAPHVPYWRSSPYGGYYSNDLTIGDTHCWDIWNGEALPYQQYVDFSSRFISEFGFEAPPNIRTVKYGVPDPEQQQSQSLMMDAHDKYKANGRQYAMYMGGNIRFRMDPLEDYLYCTQWMQAEAMSYAVTLWRRRFKKERLTAGAVIWQLNDIWPGPSWALVDVLHNPKLAWFSTRRALAPVTVGIQRKVTEPASYILRSYQQKKAAFDVWGVTVSLKNSTYYLSLKAFNVQTGREVELPNNGGTRKVTLAGNQASELLEDCSIPDDSNTVLVASLHNTDDAAVVARAVNWPEPFKYLRFAKSVELTIDSSVEGQVSLTSTVPLKGVYLYTDEKDQEADWEDNFVDLVPGETITLNVSGLNGRQVLAKWLCHWEMDVAIRRL